MCLGLRLMGFAFSVPSGTPVSWPFFWPLSVERSVHVNLCVPEIMWMFTFLSLIDLSVLVVVCVTVSHLCLHSLCFSQSFLPLCVSLLRVSFYFLSFSTVLLCSFSLAFLLFPAATPHVKTESSKIFSELVKSFSILQKHRSLGTQYFYCSWLLQPPGDFHATWFSDASYKRDSQCSIDFILLNIVNKLLTTFTALLGSLPPFPASFIKCTSSGTIWRRGTESLHSSLCSQGLSWCLDHRIALDKY